MDNLALWGRYKEYLCVCPDLGLMLDISRMNFPDGFLRQWSPACNGPLRKWTALEKGAVANPDENRMVGHYWLREPESRPAGIISAEIELRSGADAGNLPTRSMTEP